MQSEQYPSVPDIQPSALEDVVSHTTAGMMKILYLKIVLIMMDVAKG